VVSWVAYGSGEGDPNAPDPVDRLNGKPSFQIMVYPGPLGIPETIPPDAPPALLVVANDDTGAARVVFNLLQKYREAKRPVEAHVYGRGGHAFNMGYRTKLSTLRGWPQRMADWLSDSGFLSPTKSAAN
jgi:acetyl esterase/lipase